MTEEKRKRMFVVFRLDRDASPAFAETEGDADALAKKWLVNEDEGAEVGVYQLIAVSKVEKRITRQGVAPAASIGGSSE